MAAEVGVRSRPDGGVAAARSRRRSFHATRILTWLGILLLTVWVLFPFYWAVIVSSYLGVDVSTPAFPAVSRAVDGVTSDRRLREYHTGYAY